MIWIPDHRKLKFVLDRERSRYIIEVCPPGFTAVPAELIVENRQSDEIKAETIIRGANTYSDKGAGKRRLKWFTGIRPTGYSNLYTGNILTFGRDGQRRKNLVLFRFTPDANGLTVFYFPAFCPYPTQYQPFIDEVVCRGLI